MVTQRQLLQAVWVPAHVIDRTYLRAHIGQLRSKIEPDPAVPTLLLSEPRVGSRLKDEAD